MTTPLPRILAIDWSGARSGARSKIWLAEVRGGELVRLEDGRDQGGILEHLVEEAARDPHLYIESQRSDQGSEVLAAFQRSCRRHPEELHAG